MNKKGQAGFRLIMGLFVAVIIIVLFVALMPIINSSIDIAISSSSGLNCIGAADYGVYNTTAGEKSSIGCLGLRLFVPMIILVVLIAVVGFILYGDQRQQQLPLYQ